MGFYKKYLGGVGRGVLRFLDLRYRQPRSNLGLFSIFFGISVCGGVDIIYGEGGDWWYFGDGLYRG